MLIKPEMPWEVFLRCANATVTHCPCGKAIVLQKEASGKMVPDDDGIAELRWHWEEKHYEPKVVAAE